MQEQGYDFTSTGVRYMLGNRTYRGEVRSGALVKENAHPPLVTEGLWRKCQGRGTQSQRTGRLAGRFLLGGIATCASCDSGLRLSTGGNNHRPFYYCRHRHCTERAYAGANELDSFVLNTLDEELNPADPSQWVALPGGDSREVEEAEAARDTARDDLDSFLVDTRLRRALGPQRHAEAAENYVAVLEVRGRPGQRQGAACWAVRAGRPPLEHAVGARRALRVGLPYGAPRRRVEGPRAAEPPHRGRAALTDSPEGLFQNRLVARPCIDRTPRWHGGTLDKRGSALTAAPVEGKLRRPDYREEPRISASGSD